MSSKAVGDPLDSAAIIRDLRTLLASYEEELSRNPQATAKPRSGTRPEELLMLVNGVPFDLRHSAPEASRLIKAPEIVDCCKTEQADPFSFVQELTSGVFRVHPRQDKLSAGLIGPFSGPPPAGIFAVAQTTHALAPPVRFHASLWIDDCEPDAVRGRLGDMGQDLGFLLIEPGRQGFVVSTVDPSRAPDAGSSSRWSIVLATVAEPPENVEFAWADFSTIALMFSSAEGSETAVLI